MKAIFWMTVMILFLGMNLSMAQNKRTSQNGILDDKAFLTGKMDNNAVSKQSDSIYIFTVTFQYTKWARENYQKLGLPKHIDGKLLVVKVNVNADKYQLVAYKFIYDNDTEENFKYPTSPSPWLNAKPNSLEKKWIGMCNAKTID